MSDSSTTAGMRVAVDYRFSRKSFAQATHAAWKSQTPFLLVMLLTVVLLAAAGFLVGQGVPVQEQLPTFMYLSIAVAFYFWYPSFAFATDSRNRGEVHFEFTRDGVRYRRPHGSGDLAWKAVRAAWESRGFYILALPDRKLVALPKGAFAPGEEQRFRLMAALQGVPIR
ncbi:MAG: YcxB family protein [Actinomycetota bacterium]